MISLVMVYYSLNFTAYKAVSGGVFLRCGILSLGYNCNSWPCAKMVSTIIIREMLQLQIFLQHFYRLLR